MSKDLYQHFATEDIPFIDKSLEWMRQVEEHYAPILTPFINPHQVYILETLGNNREIKTFSSTSYVPSEYARVLLAPDYFAPSLENFEMALLEIEYSSKFQQLTHSKILGTVLIQKISKLPVSLVERPFSDMIESKDDYQEKEVLVSSLRLDTFLSSILKLSRSQTSAMVEKKLVQVNYHIVEKSDYPVKIGDLISVRRFGRIILLKENGQTKKDKKKLTVQLLLSK